MKNILKKLGFLVLALGLFGGIAYDAHLIYQTSKSAEASYLAISENSIPRYKEVTITSAQILDIFDTPVELIPAPGAGKVIKINSIVAVMENNTIAYIGNGLYIKVGSSVVSSDATILGLLTQVPRDMLSVLPVSLPTNSALTATSVVSDPTTGDGDLQLRITYQIINI